eukprot:TRINITY_DN12837_c0_g1_i1.p1 TRINITY_DN12837_c0_g1~~TRINITY_DN12837_c0_g1_i1.p1  ORF type:complete len:447 (+),score=179.20 TRINITY_DN12837_c0_g1_i1:104-1342(+)
MDADAPFQFRCSTQFSIYVEMERQLRQRSWWRAAPKGGTRFDLLLGDRFAIKYPTLRGGSEWGRPQLVNYYKGSHLLTLKSAMARRFREHFGSNTPEWLPQSFILMPPEAPADPNPAGDPAVPPWRRARKGSRAGREELETAAADRARFQQVAGSHLWIAKPSSGCGGGGIVISRGAEDALRAVDAAQPGSVYLVQRYVDRPLLFQGGRKFDLRCWALLCGPDYRIYLFSQGSLRTSSVAYDAADISNTTSHITNHCLQARSEDYGRWEEGNEVWYSAFNDWLDQARPGRSLEKDVLPQVRRIIRESLLAVRELIDAPAPAAGECADYIPFQLFGYDFLIDEDFEVWLLEINGSPASAEKWKEGMVARIIELVVDPRFPPPEGSPAAGAPRGGGERQEFDLIFPTDETVATP